ncbi:TPA: acyltransferase family protein, partial [Citrobacter freundii]
LNRLGRDFTGPYILYFLFGYLIISRDILYKFKKTVLYAVSFSLIIIPSIVLVFADVLYGRLIYSMHWYNSSLFILLSSVGLLILVKLVFESKRIKIFEDLSLCSFGIYLCHYLFIYVFKFIQINYIKDLSDIEKTFFYFAMSLITSFGLVSIMIKSRALKYFVS